MSRRMSCCFVTMVLLICIPLPAAAQSWAFEGRRYFDPLLAGVREAQTSALALAFADSVAFQIKDDERRRVWDIDLGAELPIFGWESAPALTQVGDGELGAGFWLFVSFHMIEDFVDDSSPIINTDYRFGGIGKIQYGLSQTSALSLRALVGHESTHLGDEFSIFGQDAHPATFERINVSWEFLDVAARLDRMGGRGTATALVGVTATVPFSDSYYSVGPTSATRSPIGPVIESRNWWDPYLGLEYRQDTFGQPGTGFFGTWGWYGSLETRYRSIYDYHRSSADVAESRQLSTNVVAGIQKVSGRFERVSPYVRFYNGVNPHGQFRNQEDFTVYGLGFRINH